MRVAFDMSGTRGRATGIGMYTTDLIRALRAFAPEVEVVELEDGEVDQRTDRRILREQLRLPALAGAARADVLHLTGFAAPLRAPCPVVLTVHDLIGVLFPQNFPLASRLYWSRYLPFTLRGASQLIAGSEHTRQDIMRLARIPRERIAVVNHGVEERFRVIEDRDALEAVRRELKLPDRFVLFVGTLEPRKGVDTCIAAYSGIADRVTEELVIAGKRGWCWEQLLEQARASGAAERIHFLDYVPAAQLPALYNLAGAFVFPSRYEGFGLPLLEAMACGTPVISSNASSLPEVVGDAGVLVPPDDVPGWAQAVVELMQDAGRRDEFTRRGLERARAFSWQRAAEQTVEVYRKACG